MIKQSRYHLLPNLKTFFHFTVFTVAFIAGAYADIEITMEGIISNEARITYVKRGGLNTEAVSWRNTVVYAENEKYENISGVRVNDSSCPNC